jgi:hypothetical protein
LVGDLLGPLLLLLILLLLFPLLLEKSLSKPPARLSSERLPPRIPPRGRSLVGKEINLVFFFYFNSDRCAKKQAKLFTALTSGSFADVETRLQESPCVDCSLVSADEVSQRSRSFLARSYRLRSRSVALSPEHKIMGFRLATAF